MSRKTFEVTAQNFEAQVLESALPVLLEFTAEWCPPCKMLAPILDDLAIKYEGQLRIGMLDCDVYPTLVQQYSIMGMPTMLLFMDGKPVERIVGFTPHNRIESKILPHLTREKA